MASESPNKNQHTDSQILAPPLRGARGFESFSASGITNVARAPVSVEAAIPHRAPFLFVDRVARIDDDSIVTEWDVNADLPAFRGHYPGNPVLPGVLISEFTFQSAAILLGESRPGC